jgi:hypothetical protein
VIKSYVLYVCLCTYNKICDFFGSTVIAPNALKFNSRGTYSFLRSPQIAICFVVIYNEIKQRKIWSPRERTYLSNKKRTLPSSVVVLKIWMFKNHRFSTISVQVNPVSPWYHGYDIFFVTRKPITSKLNKFMAT